MKLRLIKNTAFSMIVFIIFLLLTELSLRVFFSVSHKVKSPRLEYSKVLGWDMKPYLVNRGMMGIYGSVKHSTSKYGFREFGDLNTKKTKILVIGDSFTYGRYISDGKMYYDYLKEKNPNLEIFAYGGEGYGTLQEYMILDKYIDLIKPDLILWQFCDNDIINNSHELESESNIHNNHMVRPYYIKGKVYMLYPAFARGVLYKLSRYSYLLRLLCIRLNLLKADKGESVEKSLSSSNPLFQRSLKTTGEILKLVKKRAGKIPIVGFLSFTQTGLPEEIDSFLSAICFREGIHYLKGLPEIFDRAERKGIRVTGMPFDHHWNVAGNRLAGELIFDYLERKDLVKDRF